MMPKTRWQSAVRRWQLAHIAGAFLLAASMFAYIFFLWAPPAGQHFSDLYSRWYGTREFLLHGRDPYSLEVTREIQSWVLPGTDQPIPAGTADHIHEFAYPIYLCFVLAPAAFFSFPVVDRVMLGVLLVVVAASVRLWMAALRWRVPLRSSIVLVLLVVGSCGVSSGIYLRQPGLLAALFLAGTAAALARRWYTLAGVMLALSTIKPQLALLVTPWILLWAWAEWRERRRVVGAFFGAMIVLVGAPLLVAPQWLREFIVSVRMYPHYTDGRSTLDLLLGRVAGQIAAAALLALLAYVCWRMRRVAPDSRAFMLTLSLVLSTTLLVTPTMSPHSHAVLVPAALLLISDRHEFRGKGRAWRFAFFSVWALLALQWIAAIFLEVGALVFSKQMVSRLWVLPFAPSPLVPLAFTLALALPTYAALRFRQEREVASEHAVEFVAG